MNPLADIDERLVFAILNNKVSAATNIKLGRDFHFSGLDLSPDQWKVLQWLAHHDGVSQQELCEAMFKDRVAMTRIIGSVEKRGLITRVPNRFDRRKNIIRLTEQGKSFQEASAVVAQQTLRGALQGLSLVDIRTAQKVLRQVFDNLSQGLGLRHTAKPRVAYD